MGVEEDAEELIDGSGAGSALHGRETPGFYGAYLGPGCGPTCAKGFCWSIYGLTTTTAVGKISLNRLRGCQCRLKLVLLLPRDRANAFLLGLIGMHIQATVSSTLMLINLLSDFAAWAVECPGKGALRVCRR